ncbi:MAG: hypothetical protein DIZ80_01390 [endosymbiont of Galathealinum brachiosum]|uniref:Pesticidal crystal protein Cry22Aa Ig-like domain-containing protein n=1 Tax=endosymbiont of Galathealinum brachiosum TaxID=2200906 RepID=A0A370DNK5_9GAMM|nr:MAG: hypothetical protein DIZ80_01390 [endosymbiont of Galathealinum brachiosum]
MNKFRGNFLKKTILSSSIASVLSLGVVVEAQADIYEFTFANAGCVVTGTNDTCTGPGDGVFTIVNASGAPTQNTSYPYYADTDWGYGVRTQIGGSLTMDVGTGKGVATIDPFEFFASGLAIAHDVTFEDIDNANDASGNLWMAQMLFDWNANNDIPVSLVWDLQGILNNLSGIAVNDVISAVGATPGSDFLKQTFPLGASPVATTSIDTTDLCGDADGIGGNADDVACALGLNPSGTLPLIIDTAQITGLGAPVNTGIGGSPMVAGPFVGFGANFDIQRLTLAAYNDTTAPVLTLGSSTVAVAFGGGFDPNSPGVSVTCADNADGNDDITNAVGVNSDIGFTVAGATVDVNTEGNYLVTYSCTDNGVARAAITDDPNNSGSPSVPASNTSSTQTLTVTVSDVDRPVIAVTSPVTHEACTVYSNVADNTGLSATDLQDGAIPVGSIVKTDNNSIIGNSSNELASGATIDYDFTDSGTGNPGSTPLVAATQTRTVNFVDTLAPVITVAGGTTVNIESTACAAFAASLPTATVVDANGDCNATISPISTVNIVNCTVPDGQDTQLSTLIYNAADTANTPNTASETSTVTVSRSEPVITLNGGGIVLGIDDTYTEPGMDIHDVQDGDVADAVVSGTASGIDYEITGTVDTSTAGTYTVTYDATDSIGNVATTVTRTIQVGIYAQGSNFTMLNPAGTTFGGTNDVAFDWDESKNTSESDTNFNMQISSALPQPFFGFLWTAHEIRVFGPGSYSFDTTCTVAQLRGGVTACNNPLEGTQTERFITMEVGTDQLGAHILFDWNGTLNIDVVNVWEQNAVWNDPDGSASPVNNLFDGVSGEAPDPATTWKLVSIDHNADGFVGSPMVDGPFIGFYANFNAGPGDSIERLPYTGEVDVGADFTSKPGVGSIGWLAVIVPAIVLLLTGVRRKLK